MPQAQKKSPWYTHAKERLDGCLSTITVECAIQFILRRYPKWCENYYDAPDAASKRGAFQRLLCKVIEVTGVQRILHVGEMRRLLKERLKKQKNCLVVVMREHNEDTRNPRNNIRH